MSDKSQLIYLTRRSHRSSGAVPVNDKAFMSLEDAEDYLGLQPDYHTNWDIVPIEVYHGPWDAEAQREDLRKKALAKAKSVLSQEELRALGL